MYKLVIVEDEENIRRSLECYIPWKELGFEVVNTFRDGSEAVEYIKKHSCDAILTDILMNHMNGLEMIQIINEIHPEIKVVILSGHGNFAYAQQAIQYRVVDYLVKPVDEEDLIRVFENLKKQIDLERADQGTTELEARELKQMLQKSFFRNLLSGHVNSVNELAAYLRTLGIEEGSVDCPLFAFNIDLVKQREEEHTEINSDVLEDELSRCVFLTDDKIQYFVIDERNDAWFVVFLCLGHSDSERFGKKCIQIMLKLTQNLNYYKEFRFSCNVTHNVKKMSELLNLDTVNTAQKQEGPLLEAAVDEALYKKVISDYMLLVIELDLGNRDTLISIIDNMVANLKDASLEDARFILKNLYSVIELNYKKRKINVWDITKGRFDYNNLYKTKSLEEIVMCVKEDFCALGIGLKELVPENTHSIIDKITEYFNDHIGEDLGHEAIAARYRIHPGYLSRLFKQTTGETVSDYIFRIKMERAAELLKDGSYKVNEVAKAIGYSGSSYFSVVFKRYTGYSPTEYRQRMLI